MVSSRIRSDGPPGPITRDLPIPEALFKGEAVGSPWRTRSHGLRGGLARFGSGCGGARVLAVDQHSVVHDDDDVGPAVAVNVAEGQVAGLERIAHVAEVFPFEDPERDGVDEILVAGE